VFFFSLDEKPESDLEFWDFGFDRLVLFFPTHFSKLLPPRIPPYLDADHVDPSFFPKDGTGGAPSPSKAFLCGSVFESPKIPSFVLSAALGHELLVGTRPFLVSDLSIFDGIFATL